MIACSPLRYLSASKYRHLYPVIFSTILSCSSLKIIWFSAGGTYSFLGGSVCSASSPDCSGCLSSGAQGDLYWGCADLPLNLISLKENISFKLSSSYR